MFKVNAYELSVICYMLLSNNVYEFPALAGGPFYGMPGLVADSLPDRFGNAVIEQWLVSLGKSLSDFTAIDRLCYTGKRGMNALEYVPASADIKEIDADIKSVIVDIKEPRQTEKMSGGVLHVPKSDY